MSEKKGSSRPQGGAGDHVSQNYGRLKSMFADELLLEFEAKMDGMTDQDYDGEVIDAYLAALDEKAPLDSDLDAEASWNEFRTKHADLFEKDVTERNVSTTGNARKVRLRRLIPRVVALVAAVALFSALCAQAAGFNLLGVFGNWTEEIFGFLSADGGSGTDGTDFTAKDDNSEVYLSIRAILANCGITEDLAPKWYPEGFETMPPEVQSSKVNNAISCYFFGENDSYFGIRITRYNDPSMIEDPSYEKDDTSIEKYFSGDRIFYIFSNLESATATWSDGEALAINIFGNISADEIKNIIDSIGG